MGPTQVARSRHWGGRLLPPNPDESPRPPVLGDGNLPGRWHPRHTHRSCRSEIRELTDVRTSFSIAQLKSVNLVTYVSPPSGSDLGVVCGRFRDPGTDNAKHGRAPV